MKKVAALADGLLVGVNGLNVRKGGTGVCQQIVVDFQPEGADDREIVPDHQIIDLGHGAGGRVFDGEDAVLAHALLDGVEHRVEALEVHDEGRLEDFLAGNLGISPLYALAGHDGVLGEQLGGVLNGLGNGLIQRADLPVALALVAAAQLEKHGVEHPGVVFHFRPCHLCHLLENGPLPGGDENGKIICLFVVSHLGGQIHSGAEQPHQLLIDSVNFLADFR